MKGRPPKLTNADVEYARTNPDKLSQKALARALNISIVTLLKVQNKQGAYQDAVA